MVMIAQMKDKTKLREKIHLAVSELYSTVASKPHSPFHFVLGKDAAEIAGYPKKLLSNLPDKALESFAGVGFHFQTEVIKEDDHVLDIGSGSGTDLLIAAKLVGPKGKVMGVDITDAMIKKARQNAKVNGFSNISIVKADAEDLPFKDKAFDVVISNGVINLILDKKKVFKEIYRVLKPGGVLSIADITLGKSISDESRQNPRLWAECIVGAEPEGNYLKIIKEAGFSDIEVIDEIDCFAASPSENTREVAKSFLAHGIVLKASKKGGEKHGKN